MTPLQKKIAEAIKKHTITVPNINSIDKRGFLKEISDIYEEEDESYLGFDRNEFLKTAGAEE